MTSNIAIVKLMAEIVADMEGTNRHPAQEEIDEAIRLNNQHTVIVVDPDGSAWLFKRYVGLKATGAVQGGDGAGQWLWDEAYGGYPEYYEIGDYSEQLKKYGVDWKDAFIGTADLYTRVIEQYGCQPAGSAFDHIINYVGEFLSAETFVTPEPEQQNDFNIGADTLMMLLLENFKIRDENIIEFAKRVSAATKVLNGESV